MHDYQAGSQERQYVLVGVRMQLHYITIYIHYIYPISYHLSYVIGQDDTKHVVHLISHYRS